MTKSSFKKLTITSPNNVTKITSQIFFQFGPLLIKISGCASGHGLIIWWCLKKAVLVWKSGLGLGLTGLRSWKNRRSWCCNLVVLPVYMIKTKVAFVEGRLLSSQSEQFKRYSKSCDWLEKSRPSKKSHFCFDLVNRLIKSPVVP